MWTRKSFRDGSCVLLSGRAPGRSFIIGCAVLTLLCGGTTESLAAHRHSDDLRHFTWNSLLDRPDKVEGEWTPASITSWNVRAANGSITRFTVEKASATVDGVPGTIATNADHDIEVFVPSEGAAGRPEGDLLRYKRPDQSDTDWSVLGKIREDQGGAAVAQVRVPAAKLRKFSWNETSDSPDKIEGQWTPISRTAWKVRSESGSTSRFTIENGSATVNGIPGMIATNADHDIEVFVPSEEAGDRPDGDVLRYKRPDQSDTDWSVLGEIREGRARHRAPPVQVAATPPPASAPSAGQASQAASQEEQQQAQEEADAREQKINDLQNDIEMADNDADGYESMAQSAAQETNTTCFAGGIAGDFCRQQEQSTIDGYIRQANEAREKADRLRRELAELQNAPPPQPSAQAQAPQVGPGPAYTTPNLIQQTANQQTAAILAYGNGAAHRNAAPRTVPSPSYTQQPVYSQQPNPSYGQQPVYSHRPSPAYASSTNSGSSTSGQNSDRNQYAPALPASCVSNFWDSKYYGWLSFQNNCGQTINLGFVAQNGTGAFGGSGGAHNDIAPGASVNIGQTRAEVQAAGGGFILFVCPAGYIAVSASGGNLSATNTSFRCKKW